MQVGSDHCEGGRVEPEMAARTGPMEEGLNRKSSLQLVTNPPPPPQAARNRVYGRMISQKLLKNSIVRNVLKGAWERYGRVNMTEIDDQTLAFDFECDRDRDQILDASPWSIQGLSLNLRLSGPGKSLDQLTFDRLQIWTQIYGLGLDMYNPENARRIGNNVGTCLMVESQHVMQQRSYLRVKIEIEIHKPLMDGFWWSDEGGGDRWASIKFERLADFCYCCGKLGHTSQHCVEELAMSEVKPGYPRYGPWLLGLRPKGNTRTFHVGGGSRQQLPVRDPMKKSWQEVMQEKRRE